MNEIVTEKAGLSRFQCFTGSGLKLLGVIMMVFDHLHQMFFMFGVPDWFTWIGRLVAPIFLFMCTEGFRHTRSKARYMLLLLAGFEFMNVASDLLAKAMPNDEVVLMNNIFGTLLLCTVYMWGVDAFCGGIREKKPAKVALSVLVMLVPIVVGMVFVVMLSSEAFLSNPFARNIVSLLRFVPNLAIAEGGPPLVLLGLLFYLLRRWRLAQIAALVAMGLLTLFMVGGAQWMMLFAAVPILLYGGARGKGSKYFFYIFYPAHIYIFYVITCLIR
ncbi:MAG: conjugal transfer protein TraX [Clostridiales Family XIII bacterium]|jgi:hypothetical protein|nr:conjugal transfer protein TraX [Clostridiales Family XIII bacterium]